MEILLLKIKLKEKKRGFLKFKVKQLVKKSDSEQDKLKRATEKANALIEKVFMMRFN